MRGSRWLLAFGLLLALGAGRANAQLPDPGTLPVPVPDPGTLPVPVPGGGGDPSVCCAAEACVSDGDGGCTNPNAGKACIADLPTNAQAIPDRMAIAGCVEIPGVACLGGAIPSGSPEPPAVPPDPNDPPSAPIAGCISLGGNNVAGNTPGVSDSDCTTAAVDACCAANACE